MSLKLNYDTILMGSDFDAYKEQSKVLLAEVMRNGLPHKIYGIPTDLNYTLSDCVGVTSNGFLKYKTIYVVDGAHYRVGDPGPIITNTRFLRAHDGDDSYADEDCYLYGTFTAITGDSVVTRCQVEDTTVMQTSIYTKTESVLFSSSFKNSSIDVDRLAVNNSKFDNFEMIPEDYDTVFNNCKITDTVIIPSGTIELANCKISGVTLRISDGIILRDCDIRGKASDEVTLYITEQTTADQLAELGNVLHLIEATAMTDKNIVEYINKHFPKSSNLASLNTKYSDVMLKECKEALRAVLSTEKTVNMLNGYIKNEAADVVKRILQSVTQAISSQVNIPEPPKDKPIVEAKVTTSLLSYYEQAYRLCWGQLDKEFKELINDEKSEKVEDRNKEIIDFKLHVADVFIKTVTDKIYYGTFR